MEDKLMTPDEVAKATGLKVTTIQQWLRDGKINGYKVGRQWRIYEADFLKILKNPKEN